MDATNECTEPGVPKRELGVFRGSILFKPGWDDPMTDDELAEWYGAPFSTGDETPVVSPTKPGSDR